jgi:hypothetical protein
VITKILCFQLSVDMLVPRRETENLAALCSLNVDCMMLYINNRPVRYKKLEKVSLYRLSLGTSCLLNS